MPRSSPFARGPMTSPTSSSIELLLYDVALKVDLDIDHMGNWSLS